MLSKQVTKRALGTSYLVGTGVILSIALVVRASVAADLTPIDVATTLSGLLPALSLASAKYWLPRIQLEDEQVWTVAKWGALGIAVLTLLNTAIFLIHALITPVVTRGTSLLISNVAVGGIAGVFVGSVWELNKRTRSLDQKNGVLNRVFRHNIRNDMNVILGHVALLESEIAPEHRDRVTLIKHKSEEIIELSNKVRDIQRTVDRDRESLKPIDLVAITEDQLDVVRRSHPNAEFDVDLPNEAWIYADELIEAAIDNVLENAIEHGSDHPTVRVSATTPGPTDGWVELRIEDDGPGIPDAELEILSREDETALQHSSGMGLWLVNWLVNYYNGDLMFEENDPHGTVVTIRLQRAIPGSTPVDSDSPRLFG